MKRKRLLSVDALAKAIDVFELTPISSNDAHIDIDLDALTSTLLDLKVARRGWFARPELDWILGKVGVGAHGLDLSSAVTAAARLRHYGKLQTYGTTLAPNEVADAEGNRTILVSELRKLLDHLKNSA